MFLKFSRCHIAIAATLFAVAFLSGCASTSHNPQDPFESFNRGAYAFNDTAYKAVIKPVATAYRNVIPKPARTGVSNFFSNLDDVIVVFNDVLQFKLKQAVADSARVLFNSTFGIFGLIDIASDAGLQKHNEDFGQTLGYWGFNSGPFLMLPLLGPSSFRDGVGLVVDHQIDPVSQLDDISTRSKIIALKVTSIRSDVLDVENVFEEAALDLYAFLRDAYIQRRRDQVYDGNPPRDANGNQNNSRLDQEEVVSENNSAQPEKIVLPSTIEMSPQLTIRRPDTEARSDVPISNNSEKLTPAQEEADQHIAAIAINAASVQAPQVIRFWFPN